MQGVGRMGAQEKPIIVHTEGTRGGRAIIDGTRITVSDVIEAYQAFLDHQFVQQYLAGHPHLTENQVYAALGYYRDHQEEINPILVRRRELAREHGQIPT